MRTKNLLLFSLILTCFFTVSCGDDSAEASPFKYMVELNMDNFGNTQTIMENPSAHSGTKICHVDSGQNFGLFYTLNVPDSLIGKALLISIESWIRTGKTDNGCGITCSVTLPKDSILFWHGLDGKTVISQPNEWSNLSGDFNIPSNVMQSGSKINIMCLNGDAKSYFDVDDLTILFSDPVKTD